MVSASCEEGGACGDSGGATSRTHDETTYVAASRYNTFMDDLVLSLEECSELCEETGLPSAELSSCRHVATTDEVAEITCTWGIEPAMCE
jgi:hypothetical protein